MCELDLARRWEKVGQLFHLPGQLDAWAHDSGVITILVNPLGFVRGVAVTDIDTVIACNLSLSPGLVMQGACLRGRDLNENT